MSWSSGRSSSMSSRSYWPRTRVDIHPSRAPSCAPVTALPTGCTTRPTGVEDVFASRDPSRSSTGRRRRRKLTMLAFTQPARSVTRARAGPASERRPVASATSSSARAVSSSKSGAREAEAGLEANRSGPATLAATRAARSQATGSGPPGPGVTSAPPVPWRDDLEQVGHHDRHRDQDARDEDHDRQPVVPDNGGERGHGPIVDAALAGAVSGDLLAARPRHRHGLVQVAELALVVDRELRAAPRLEARPVLLERPRRPVVARDGQCAHGSLAHSAPTNLHVNRTWSRVYPSRRGRHLRRRGRQIAGSACSPVRALNTRWRSVSGTASRH